MLKSRRELLLWSSKIFLFFCFMTLVLPGLVVVISSIITISCACEAVTGT